MPKWLLNLQLMWFGRHQTEYQMVEYYHKVEFHHYFYIHYYFSNRRSGFVLVVIRVKYRIKNNNNNRLTAFDPGQPG